MVIRATGAQVVARNLLYATLRYHGGLDFLDHATAISGLGGAYQIQQCSFPLTVEGLVQRSLPRSIRITGIGLGAVYLRRGRLCRHTSLFQNLSALGIARWMSRWLGI